MWERVWPLDVFEPVWEGDPCEPVGCAGMAEGRNTCFHLLLGREAIEGLNLVIWGKN